MLVLINQLSVKVFAFLAFESLLFETPRHLIEARTQGIIAHEIVAER
jgi:hypothetical protein